jgi:hypothetical protein
MSQNSPTIAGICRAAEARDAKSLKSLYAANAMLTIIDTDNPLSKPRTIMGAKDIGSFLDDVNGRDMKHTLDHVIASTMTELGLNGIINQTIVQAWDS